MLLQGILVNDDFHIYPSEIESPMIRQFLNSGFTPSGGPGLHTRDALRTFMSAALTGDDLGQSDTVQYVLKAMD